MERVHKWFCVLCFVHGPDARQGAVSDEVECATRSDAFDQMHAEATERFGEYVPTFWSCERETL